MHPRLPRLGVVVVALPPSFTVSRWMDPITTPQDHATTACPASCRAVRSFVVRVPCRHFFFARLLIFAFVAPADLSIKKSSRFFPSSFIAATNHLGVAPLPAHSSPLGPRYFAATFRPFILLPRSLPPPAMDAIEPPKLASCRSSVSR